MDVKKTIVDKFMKSEKEETTNIIQQEDAVMSTEINNIPDEFTAKLINDEKHPFPSIHVEEEEETKNYVYLDDDELSRDFLIDRDLSSQYTIQLVMYHINNSLDTPFLEFYLEQSGEEYGFPERLLDNQRLENNIEEVNKTQYGGMDITTEQHGDIEIATKTTIIDNDAVNPFEQQIFEFFHNTTGYSDIIAESAYKGFVEIDNHVYVLFENKEKELAHNDADKKHIWAILDEILKQFVLNAPIHESTYKLFLQHTKLANITSEGKSVELPIVVYPVDKVNNIYENIYYIKDESDENLEQTYLITLPMEDTEYGHMFMFTHTILPSNHPIDTIKRMVIFTKNALYMLTKPTKEIFEKYPLVRFKENDVTFWGASTYLLFTELL